MTELPNLMDFLHKFSRGARRQSVSEVHYPIHLGANAVSEIAPTVFVLLPRDMNSTAEAGVTE